MEETKEVLGGSILEEERKKASFDVQVMKNYLNGGEEITKWKDEVLAELDVFDKYGVYYPDDDQEPVKPTQVTAKPSEDHTTAQAREQSMMAIREHYNKLFEDTGISLVKRQARVEYLSLYDPSYFTRNGVHFGLFLSALQGQGDEFQIAEWFKQGIIFQILGCFAMTEIGHGSFLRGLETTATYDPKTEEFIINSPTITSTKWWIGGAAHTATHATVFAQLILPSVEENEESGKKMGVHTFVVPLRSMENHDVLPGITIGDCGVKFGRHGIDNGWLRFDHVRIPRNNMLNKYTKVDADGTYTVKGRKELQYGALIGGRATMVSDSALWLQAATTIAIRYLTVRREGDSFTPGGPEPQLIEYRTVQSRLITNLATAYALTFTSKYMQSVAAPKTSGEFHDVDPKILPDLHATCAGLKAFCTWACYDGLDKMRQCLGGHGYSGYTGIARMFSDFAVQCTWEGDNTVMALQTARYLVNAYGKLLKDEPLVGSVAYLESLPRINRTKRTWGVAKGKKINNENLLDAFRYLLAKKVERVSKAVYKDEKKVGFAKAWNMHSPELVDCSKAHCYYVMADKFVDAINGLEKSENEKERQLVPVLNRLCALFCYNSLSLWLDWFVATGYMSASHMFFIKDEIVNLCSSLRDECIPLVDSFGLSDTLLRSPLGRYDGNVYEHYFERVKSVEGSQDKTSYYESAITPVLRAFL
eukprot:CAMPEP_0201509926 /NCGR_PEP_ID=MMETSP0161_2-20130828/2821_1 /ASSEMBLY_ACC=CAM_ASM_000251 /TAXON_ID=180227 /ORGANISM="Neoparamoeba aestuarina, Strain SoJaBio B1-5/56/2" /LENGTH=702 /DNA_ID=CAMNT_0047905019 /DNA_START=69 /DNA_END=2177 /DNA_ORIENTATION=-